MELSNVCMQAKRYIYNVYSHRLTKNVALKRSTLKRALFLVTGKFYGVAQALTKAPRQPASLKCNFLIGWKNDVI